jgi:dienelactone hydrolase
MERGPELASHGYVVVAADPADVYGTVFPDGTYLKGESSLVLTHAGFQDRIRDLRCVLEELELWNRTDPALAGRLDLAKVATLGYSWGGGVAAEVGRTDPRVSAVVLLDAYLQQADDLVRLGLSKPLLGMYSTEVGGNITLHDKATHDAIWLQISGTTHGEFSDYYWTSGSNPRSGREAAQTMNAYILWFLQKYLKGSTEPMPALADYPRVTNFRRK